MAQESKDIPMICETLRDLNDDGILTAKQLADLLNISLSSAYRYLSGETDLNSSQLRTIFRHCRRKSVQERLLADFLEGTGWIAEQLDLDADVNGDGDVNTADVMDGAIKAARGIADTLEAARGFEKSGFSRLSHDSATIIQASVRGAVLNLLAVSRAVSVIEQPRAVARA